VPPGYAERAAERGLDLHAYLSELAAAQQVGEHGLVALDWHNGNRSVLVDHELSGVVVGLTLATRPEEVYRALLEATAFGTRKIIDAFESSGVGVAELTVAGGLVRNPLLMQIYADVTRRDLSVVGSAQGPALGSAIHAAVAAGAYPDVQAASAAMGGRQPAAYRPDPARAAAYDPLYQEYLLLHDYFGRGQNDAMHRLRDIRRKARSR
jgi:L-ribulokinase